MTKISLDELREIAEAAAGQIDKVFIHWSAGHYGQFFDDYHVMIDFDGSIYSSTDDLTESKAHTWHQNTGAVGLALACAYNANTEDLGPEPPTPEQIEGTARAVAVLCQGLGLVCDFNHVRTHAEQADLDDYGPDTTCERWDLWFFTGADKGDGGNVLRGKANWYINNGTGA